MRRTGTKQGTVAQPETLQALYTAAGRSMLQGLLFEDPSLENTAARNRSVSGSVFVCVQQRLSSLNPRCCVGVAEDCSWLAPCALQTLGAKEGRGKC